MPPAEQEDTRRSRNNERRRERERERRLRRDAPVGGSTTTTSHEVSGGASTQSFPSQAAPPKGSGKGKGLPRPRSDPGVGTAEPSYEQAYPAATGEPHWLQGAHADQHGGTTGTNTTTLPRRTLCLRLVHPQPLANRLRREQGLHSRLRQLSLSDELLPQEILQTVMTGRMVKATPTPMTPRKTMRRPRYHPQQSHRQSRSPSLSPRRRSGHRFHDGGSRRNPLNGSKMM